MVEHTSNSDADPRINRPELFFSFPTIDVAKWSRIHPMRDEMETHDLYLDKKWEAIGWPRA